MAKILIAGAGGAPSEGVIKSLLKVEHDVAGMCSEPTDLILSAAARKYYVPYANTAEYKSSLIKILKHEQPELIHFQNDLEIFHASILRDEIHATGCKTFMPRHEVIDICVHKFKTWERFKDAGIKVPENKMIKNEEDLRCCFDELADKNGKIWLRASSMGAGGKGALPTNSYELAKLWIDHHDGWGDFVAAEMLTANTVTWMSIWYEGELIVAQGRLRKGWVHGNRTISGVTGVTKVGQTYSDHSMDSIAIAAIKAVDNKPHGIFGVDMAYDEKGVPNPTEINISRFFTTILFFTEAGLNFPSIFVELGLTGKTTTKLEPISPLQDGLMWMRGMDVVPKLCNNQQMRQEIIFL
jgi:carbamoyl-phosphate synthase large subunit